MSSVCGMETVPASLIWTAVVLTQLRGAPLRVAPGAAAAASEHALVLIAELRVVHERRKRTLKQLILALRQMRTRRTDGQRPSDAEIVDSLPGAGTLTVAAVIGEAAQSVAERNLTALRTHSGVAPVTRQTGKHRGVSMRYACSERLRDAFYHFAMTSVQADPIARRHYDELRRQGHTHARALRGVADRWITVLMAMLRAGELYDPTRRKAWCAAHTAEQTP